MVQSRRIHGDYELHYDADPGWCFYCDDPADGIDHALPQSAVISNPGLQTTHRHMMFQVPVCDECNAAAGTTVDYSMAERAARIAVVLSKRKRTPVMELRLAHLAKRAQS